MVYGLRAQSQKDDWDQVSEERAQGSEEWDSGITRLLSLNQWSDLLHGLKISSHNIFPHNKVSVLRNSWPRNITYSCFRLAAVPVIRSPGCLTKTWYHILNLFNCWGHRNMNLKSLFSLCNSAPQRAVNVRGQRKRLIHIFFFCETWGKEKGQKEILWQRKVHNFFLDWFTPGKGSSIEFFSRSNITIQDNRQTDSLKANFTV